METALSVFAKPPRTVWSEPVRDVRGLVLTADSTHALIRAAVRALFTLRAETLSLVRMCTTHPHLPRAVWTTNRAVCVATLPLRSRETFTGGTESGRDNTQRHSLCFVRPGGQIVPRAGYRLETRFSG
ncbi:hypothetical protein NQZ68_000441 [Dissostichus eleginoides]|nr:hypothetical protein NQZ68_000441 [Dissostichus eleginoides]